MQAKKVNGSVSPTTHPPRRWRWTARIASLALLACAATLCVAWAFTPARGHRVDQVEVVAEFPHDVEAFTQGLAIVDGQLYEGTGQYGRSELRKVDLETGRVLQRVPLDRRYFGEGIAIWGDRIIQLTWKAGLAIVYDKETLKPLGTFRYEGEGWGLTHDGEHLIISDGSSTLRFLDPKTFKVVRRLPVTNNRRRVTRLNELEYVNGDIWANVWMEDYLVRINPENGEVVSTVDLRGLMPRRPHEQAVLNGIAYDDKSGRLFVTGKLWPTLFEIKLKP